MTPQQAADPLAHRNAWVFLLGALKREFDALGKLNLPIGAIQVAQLYSWVNSRYGSLGNANDWAQPANLDPGEVAPPDTEAVDDFLVWLDGNDLSRLAAEATTAEGGIDWLELARLIEEEQGPISDPYWLDRAPKYIAAWQPVIDGWMGWDYTQPVPAWKGATPQ